MPRTSKENDNKDIVNLLAEIKEEKKQLVGWEELQILAINKYGVEAVVKTNKGVIKMTMKDLFIQYFFMSRVWEQFGISLKKVKENVYQEWRAEWAKLIVNMDGEYGTSMELLSECLEGYVENAEYKEDQYVASNGEPVILSDGTIAFKPIKLSMWLKKTYSLTYSEDQLRSILKDLGCTSRQIGPTRARVWIYKPKVHETFTLFNQEQKTEEAFIPVMNDVDNPDDLFSEEM